MRESKVKKKRVVTYENFLYLKLKRLSDVFFSCLGLLFFMLAYVLLFIPYKLGENKGPIVFKQKRIGKFGEEFWIYKFRSMKVNADEILKSDIALYKKYIENGYKLEPSDDPRITKLGAFLRKTSIDEFPQFINVIKGEMSLVGPRPVVIEELQEYENLNLLNEFISMKPGITGVWQTSGRSNVGYPERVYLEVSYKDNDSIVFDFKILIKTALKVFKKEGAY